METVVHGLRHSLDQRPGSVPMQYCVMISTLDLILVLLALAIPGCLISGMRLHDQDCTEVKGG